MHARAGTLQASPDRLDDMVAQLREEQIPRYRDQRGYKGFTVLADRSSGKVIGISFWGSEQDLHASDQLGREARSAASETGGASGEPTVEVFEVLLDDMV
jgi:heme-degrading monooxygenase HmoA